MGASMNTGGRRGARLRPMAEINVTPFVDVMLVLLIVFMVTAPLLTPGIAIDVPETAAKPLEDQGEPLTVSIAADGVVYVQDVEIALDELVPHLEAVAEAGYEQRIFIRGDQTRAYGDVVKVMGLINAAGFTQIGLVTDPELQ